MAAELGWHAFEWAICEAAKESRRATLRAWDSLKRASEQAVEVLYKKEGEAEAAAEEVVRTAADRARAAGWAVISTSEHVYFAAYQEALAAGMEAEQAKEVAAKSVEAATGKAVAVWRRGEQLATDTAKAAETMASKGEKAIENVWERTTTYVLDTERAFRRSLYKEMVAVEVEVHEATEDVAWAVHYVVAETVEVTHEACDAFLGRIQAWHDSLVEAEVGTLRAVAGAADAEADRAEQKQKACCDVQ
uniref:Uncharacterized protein n=1 Tax=Pyrodinium bahamense TaxID=73915 RepID=A0A6T8ZB74_9DINO|mmetsp:Transcript_44851/g.124714  ORF Transcript_44851/g.124714 Transcript_44851/m.124714 type:complete len:248 (+) Transcript_44851:2-745(+)